MDKVMEKWNEILQMVKEEHGLTDVSFNTWIKPLEVFAIDGNTLYILVPSEQMGLSYINKKYYLPLKVAIGEVTGIEYDIQFILPDQAQSLKFKNNEDFNPFECDVDFLVRFMSAMMNDKLDVKDNEIYIMYKDDSLRISHFLSDQEEFIWE